MLLIVFFHEAFLHVNETGQPMNVKITYLILGAWGILGDYLFLIISAYFLVDQQFRCKRVINLVFQVFTYILLWAVLSIGYQMMIGKGVLQAGSAIAFQLFTEFWDPLWSKRYWFITAYFYMQIASPVLNRILFHANRRIMRIILLVFIFIPIYSQSYSSPVNDIIEFSYVYLLVGAIKRNEMDRLSHFAKPKWVLVLAALILSGNLMLLWPNIPEPFELILSSTIACTKKHSIILLIFALTICFTIFQKKPTYNSSVNRFASYLLGVYLLTEMRILDYYGVQEYIFKKATWIGILPCDMLFPLRFIAVSLFVFLFSIGIEFCRAAVIQKPVMRFLERRCDGVFNKVDMFMSSFTNAQDG